MGGPGTVFCGDCLNPVSGFAAMGDRSIDVVITDPPYTDHVHSKQRRKKAGGIDDADIDFSAINADGVDLIGGHIGRVVKRWAIVFCAIEQSQQWAAAIEAGGAGYIRTMLWIKKTFTPQFAGDRPAQGYEAAVLAHPKGRKRWNGGGKRGVFFHGLDEKAARTGHQTQKPQSLMRELIQLFSDPGELIADPFAGSGSTGVAAIAEGRRFIGWEKDPHWAEVAQARIDGRGVADPKQPTLF